MKNSFANFGIKGLVVGFVGWAVVDAFRGLKALPKAFDEIDKKFPIGNPGEGKTVNGENLDKETRESLLNLGFTLSEEVDPKDVPEAENAEV